MRTDEIKAIGIAGAGVMGSSVAQIFAKNNYDVVIHDLSDEVIAKSRNFIELNQRTLVEQGALTKERSEAVQSRLRFSCDINVLSEADFIIEAIVEKMDIKQSFWSKLSGIMRDEAIVTSNTSGLSLTEIAKAVKKPERFAGMHWINPPHLVPLVEVICAGQTSQETAKIVYDLAAAIGQKPIMVKKDVPGFVLNRIQFSILREAMSLVESGVVSTEDVDNVLKYGLGMRYAAIGPFETADFGGLDTFYNIASYLFRDLNNAKEPPALLVDLVQNGCYGVKSGKGFYDYSDGKDKAAIQRRDTMFIKLAKCLWQE